MQTRIERARLLRREATDAERRLWYFVRNRQLRGYRFRRQMPIGRYIADFACIEARLVVELDGGQHVEAIDAARTRAIERAGYRVLRFWNGDVFRDIEAVLERIAGGLDDAPVKCAVVVTREPTAATESTP